MQRFTVMGITLLAFARAATMTAEQGRGAAESLVRVEACGGGGVIYAVVELDPAAIKKAGWLTGWDLRMVVEPEAGGRPSVVESILEPGERLATLVSETGLVPGRYTVRAEAKAKMGGPALQASTFAVLPGFAAKVGTAALARRRGPGTAMAYEPTANPRFRRTERLRIEVPLLGQGLTSSARVLTRLGQPLPLSVTVGERDDGSNKWATAEVVLAPLAAGEYVFEIVFAGTEESDIVSYAFRLIP